MKFLVFAALVAVTSRAVMSDMDVYQSWNNPDFNFPDGVSRDELINNGSFIPNNVVILDVDVVNYNCPDQKIFLSTPRFRPGTPATLSTLGENGLLNPYPSWEWQSDSDCSKIISVLRMTTDSCNRLWVLDSGKIDIFEATATSVCPPKIVAIDLESDEVVGSYELSSDLYSPSSSLLGNIVVESRQCFNSFVYLGDINYYKLTVFNLQNQQFRQWNSSLLQPTLEYEQFNVDGINFTLDDGIIAMAYYPGNDQLYFNAFASVTQKSVSAGFLRSAPVLGDSNDFATVENGTRVSQATTHAVSSDGVLFYNPVSENSIRCWDVEKSFSDENQVIVAQNDETIQFVTGIKWRNGRIWAVSTRLQKYIDGSISPDETNYRVLTKSEEELVSGTNCDKRGSPRPRPHDHDGRRPPQPPPGPRRRPGPPGPPRQPSPQQQPPMRLRRAY